MSKLDSSEVLPPVRRRWTHWLLVPVALFMWVSFFRVPTPLSPMEVDSSWVASLGHFFKHDFQAGRDYIFTYGPLGFMYIGVSDPSLVWHQWTWAVVVNAVLAGIFVWSMRYTSLTCGFLFCTLAALVATHTECSDGFFVLGMLLLYVILDRENRFAFWWMAPAMLFIAALSLAKFTFALFSVPIVVLLAVSAWRKGYRFGALWPPVCYAGAIAGLWVGFGQSLANLPGFIHTSYEVASGYTAAMSLTGALPRWFDFGRSWRQ